MGKSVGLVGNIRNKVGNFVFSTWKGIQVVRVYQPNVTNPRSDDQVAQRTRFDSAVQYGIALSRSKYLKSLWQRVTPSGMSAYNFFVRTQLLSANFSPDNILCPNSVIPSYNNDDVQHVVFNGDQSCTSGDYSVPPGTLSLNGCGTVPTHLLLVHFYNSNCLSDPSQSPFRDVRLCEQWILASDITSVGFSAASEYPDQFFTCGPSCDDVHASCETHAAFVIPVVSSEPISDPVTSEMIIAVGTPVILCTEPA